MENKGIMTIQDSELDKELIFEKQVITRVTFRKGDVIDQLMSRIKNLENKVKILNKNNITISEDALTKLWDNENDRRWNNI